MTTTVRTFLKRYIKQCKYISQGDNPYCVPIAIANARTYLGLKYPDVESLAIEMGCGKDGPYQCVVEKSIKKYLGKWTYKTRDFDKFMKTGGIIIIKSGSRRTLDLHCCLCLISNGGYTLINAFNGEPTVLTGYTFKEVKSLLPGSKYAQHFWAFKKKL